MPVSTHMTWISPSFSGLIPIKCGKSLLKGSFHHKISTSLFGFDHFEMKLLLTEGPNYMKIRNMPHISQAGLWNADSLLSNLVMLLENNFLTDQFKGHSHKNVTELILPKWHRKFENKFWIYFQTLFYYFKEKWSGGPLL